MTTGYYGSWNRYSVVTDLANPEVTCKDWANYPYAEYNGVGGIINDSLFVCGGKNTDFETLDACHLIGPLETTENVAQLNVASFESAAVVLNQKLFVTGGAGQGN